MFTKLFLHCIFSILYYYFFFAIFTLFNFSSSSTIIFLIQAFIYTDHCCCCCCFFFFFSSDSLYRFLNFLIYIFVNSTMFSLCSTFHLLHHSSSILIFRYISYYFISTLLYSFQVVHNKRGQYSLSLSLSLSNFVSLSVDFLLFQPLIFSANGSFCYC